MKGAATRLTTHAGPGSRVEDRSRQGVEPSMGDGITDDVGAGPQVQFLGRARLVGLDRLDADVEPGCDFLVAEALRREAEHLAFAVTEMLLVLRRSTGLGKIRQRLVGDLRIE